MKHHEDQKITALTLIAEGMKIADISEQLSIPTSTLYRWRSDPKPQKFQEPNTQHVDELTTKLSELELRLAKLEKHNQRAFQKQQDYEEPKKLQFNLR